MTGYRVLQVGAATPPHAPPADVRMDVGRAPPDSAQQALGGLAAAWGWYRGLPRASAVLIAVSVFLVLINLFSGFNHLWFQWPVTPLLLIAFLKAAFPRDRS